MTNEQMHDFARTGAQARLQSISEERAAIIRMFPHLRSATASSVDGAAPVAGRARKRRRMSAAERKAIGRRMRAYWAKRRAEKTGSNKARLKPARKSGMSAEARKAQGERMRAYWAAKRAAKVDGAGAGTQSETARQNGASTSKRGGKAARRQDRKK